MASADTGLDFVSAGVPTDAPPRSAWCPPGSRAASFARPRSIPSAGSVPPRKIPEMGADDIGSSHPPGWTETHCGSSP